MDHTLFPDHKRFFAKYEIRDEEGYQYSDKMAFYVLDLTAAGDATEEEKKQGLVDWASAFNAESWEEVNRIDNDGVKEAKKAMERIMSDSYRRQLLWDRKMAEMDYRSQMSAAERRGEARGETRGIAIGEARGETRGIAIGETRGWSKATKEAEERDRKRVRNMYAEGDSVEKIARSMEIDADQIRKWIQ